LTLTLSPPPRLYHLHLHLVTFSLTLSPSPLPYHPFCLHLHLVTFALTFSRTILYSSGYIRIFVWRSPHLTFICPSFSPMGVTRRQLAVTGRLWPSNGRHSVVTGESTWPETLNGSHLVTFHHSFTWTYHAVTLPVRVCPLTSWHRSVVWLSNRGHLAFHCLSSSVTLAVTWRFTWPLN